MTSGIMDAMPTEITRIDRSPLSPELKAAVQKAKDFAGLSVPESTRRAYSCDWSQFKAWCEKRGVAPLPAHPAAVAAFLADSSEFCRPSTLRRRLSGIGKMHEINGQPNPCTTAEVKATVKGIERLYGARQEGKAPLTYEKVLQMVQACPTNTLQGLRTRAILLLGFAGAFRRSELAALRIDDLRWTPEGVTVLVRRSKTDQRGQGQLKAVPFVDGPMCAARALKAWLVGAQIDSGPVFRGFLRNGLPRAEALNEAVIGIIVKEAAERVGLDPKEFGAHSLRAGHVTEARRRGIADANTMSTTGHRRVETLDTYDRRENAFEKTSAGEVLKEKKR